MKTSRANNRLKVTAGLAPVVDAFIAGVNEGRLSDVTDVFHAGAIVNDQLEEYVGLDAIAAWVRNDLFGQRARITAVLHRLRPTGVVSTIEMTGDFDGLGLPEPLVLSCYFSLSNEKIDQLIILRKGL